MDEDDVKAFICFQDCLRWCLATIETGQSLLEQYRVNNPFDITFETESRRLRYRHFFLISARKLTRYGELLEAYDREAKFAFENYYSFPLMSVTLKQRMKIKPLDILQFYRDVSEHDEEYLKGTGNYMANYNYNDNYGNAIDASTDFWVNGKLLLGDKLDVSDIIEKARCFYKEIYAIYHRKWPRAKHVQNWDPPDNVV